MTDQRQSGRLPLLLKASWGVGGLGGTSMLYLINMFVVYFLVRHVGISAAIAGVLFAITRIYDAVIDPLIGNLSDRSDTRWGRRRPWMLAGAILASAACIAVFHPPDFEPGLLLYACVLLALFAYTTGYSLFAIPYMAQGAEMTDNYQERASLMAWRTFFVYGSGLMTVSGAAWLVARLGSDKAAYGGMSLAAAAVVAVTMLWVVTFTGRAATATGPARKPPLFSSLLGTLRNKPFLIMLGTKIMGQLGTAFSGASMLFYITYVMHRDETAVAVFSLTANIMGICSVPLWNRLLRNVERRTLLLILLTASAFVHLSWMLGGPDENQLVFVSRAFVLGALGSGSVLLAMAMLADTIELDRIRSGEQREGAFVGAFELMQTTAFIVAPLIAGFAFSLAGLESGEVASGDQPESAVMMIRLLMGVAPAVCVGLGAALLTLYRLDEARLKELRAQSSVA
ncbi:MAG: MFS transporter [Gammaproteobacteria bacterium]|nr:MFS transporter [Gammaproteobacteria bacterium]MDE0414431.1 MFS transporter [Gammaproteobacteria bacterium]